jgi:hypothetical protein
VVLAGADVLVDEEVVAAGCEAVVVELLLLPHPATRAETPIATTAANPRRAEVAFNTDLPPLFARQIPGTLTESWHS